MLSVVQYGERQPFTTYRVELPPNPHFDSIFIGLPTDTSSIMSRCPILFDASPFRNVDIVHYILKANNIGVSPLFFIPRATLSSITDTDSEESAIRRELIPRNLQGYYHWIKSRDIEDVASLSKFSVIEISYTTVYPVEGKYNVHLEATDCYFPEVVTGKKVKNRKEIIHPLVQKYKEGLKEKLSEEDWSDINNIVCWSDISNVVWQIQDSKILLGVRVGYVRSKEFSGFILISGVLNKGREEYEIILFLDIFGQGIKLEVSLWKLLEVLVNKVQEICFRWGVYSIFRESMGYIGGGYEDRVIHKVVDTINKELLTKGIVKIKIYANTDPRGLLLTSSRSLAKSVTREMEEFLEEGIGFHSPITIIDALKEIRKRKEKAIEFYKIGE